MRNFRINRITHVLKGLAIILLMHSGFSHALTASGSIQSIDLGGIDTNALVVVFTIDTAVSGCSTAFTFSYTNNQAAEAYYGALLTGISTGNPIELIYTVAGGGLCAVTAVKLT